MNTTSPVLASRSANLHSRGLVKLLQGKRSLKAGFQKALKKNRIKKKERKEKGKRNYCGNKENIKSKNVNEENEEIY